MKAARALSAPSMIVPSTIIPAAAPVKGGTEGVGVAVVITPPVPFAVYVGVAEMVVTGAVVDVTVAVVLEGPVGIRKGAPLSGYAVPLNEQAASPAVGEV